MSRPSPGIFTPRVFTPRVFTLLALVTPLTAQPVVRASTSTRQATRLVYAGDLTPRGDIFIHYDAPTWREGFRGFLAPGSDRTLPLGQNFRTTLDTDLDLEIGGVAVPAGVYQLGLFHAADDTWALELHPRTTPPGQPGSELPALRAPLRHGTGEHVDVLDIALQPVDPKTGDGELGRSTLRLRWADQQLDGDVVVAVQEIDRLAGAPPFAASPADKLVTTASGLQYEVIEPGEGASPTADARVTVHYTGWLTDGTVFDSWERPDQPLTFSLGQVIPGWQEGLQLMKPGAVYQLTIPPELGYGPRTVGKVPANAMLVFRVELLAVE